jgi:DNA primase
LYTNADGCTSVFDVLREEVPIERLIETNGHRKALCVSHSEKTPSMHVYEDHVHCYGCRFHGDVVDVWGKQKGIGHPIEAALDLAREFNIRLPKMSEEGRQKAEAKRREEVVNLISARAFREVLVGSHDDPTHREPPRAPEVRKWWEGRGFGPELLERFILGADDRTTTATVPFWYRGRVQGLIHRKLEGEPKYILPKAEKFPEGHRPLFIPAPITGELFLVEGYLDGLAVAATDRSVAAIGGTNASEEQLAELRKISGSGSRKIYILPDRDEAGAEAATMWARALYPAAKICPADYGEGCKDVADLFAKEPTDKVTEHLNRLVSASRDILDIEMEIAGEIDDRRARLAYTSENIAPLLAPLHPEGYRDATADIVAETTNLKKTWITNAIKDHREAMEREEIQQMAAEARAEKERRQEEYRARVAEAQPEIDALLEPGVLGRLRDTAARMHQVYGDREPLELALLVALGAQLDPLPNGRPLGASILLTATAGRGKNHIVDAAVTPLPEEFYFTFEIASGQSLYYKADEDPDFLKHTFAYQNEIEGAEALWEFLRPMLSKGWAKKIVTAKDLGGNMTTRTIIVEGPVTIAIPTIRNKTDEQLQTRLLVAELPDYVGRVKHHSAAVSEQLLPDAATADYSHERWLWQEGLRSLTEIRRVVFPLRHADFALDDDQISHGARLWANLLSLMATNAWLEQKNRRTLDLGEDTLAIEATPDDYETAYRIFNEVCKRTVVNLSDTHRSILNGLYKLMENHPERGGFRQREIAEAGGVSLGAVSNHKTFLVMSAKLIKESGDGLCLVEGADPSWWETGEMMEGLPTPAQVRRWWQERGPEPPEHGEHVNTDGEEPSNPHNYGESGVHARDEHDVNTSGVR